MRLPRPFCGPGAASRHRRARCPGAAGDAAPDSVEGGRRTNPQGSMRTRLGEWPVRAGIQPVGSVFRYFVFFNIGIGAPGGGASDPSLWIVKTPPPPPPWQVSATWLPSTLYVHGPELPMNVMVASPPDFSSTV